MGLVTRLFEKRSFDSQWTEWLQGRDKANVGYAGVSVTPESAIKNPAVLACERIISEGIAGVPLLLYKRIANGKERAVDHSLYSILHIQPNEEMTSFTFREMEVLHLLNWGNFYAEKQYNNAGRLIALWPLLPWKMTVSRDNMSRLVYKYRLPNNTEIIIPRENILHIPGMSFDGLMGKSIVALASEAIGLGMALEEFGAKFFGQGTQFGGFLEHPNKIGDKAYENLQASLKEKYQGLTNAHRVMILEEGMKYSRNTIAPNEAQFLESRKFQTIEIARMFNVKLHKINDLDHSNFSNIEQQNIEHVVDTLRPWCVRIEQSKTIQLLTPIERKQYFIEHLLDGLLRGDIKSRYEAYSIAKLNGWLNSDEIRELENMNPMPDGAGKKYWQPLNMIDASMDYTPKSVEPEADPEEGPEEPAQASVRSARSIKSKRGAILKSRLANNYRQLYEDATTRVIKLEKSGILKAANSIFAKRNMSLLNFNEFLDQFYAENYNAINSRLSPVVNTYAKVIYNAALEEINAEPNTARMEDFVKKYTDVFVEKYISSSRNQMRDVAREAVEQDLVPLDEITKRVTSWEENRPAKVGMNETIQLAGAMSYFAYKDSGIQSTVWVAAGGNPCPFCESLDGMTTSIEQPYKTASDVMEAEGQEPLTFTHSIYHAPAHGGCDCQIMAG